MLINIKLKFIHSTNPRVSEGRSVKYRGVELRINKILSEDMMVIHEQSVLESDYSLLLQRNREGPVI